MTPSAYPGALDTLATNKDDDTPTGAGDHAGHHNLLADAVNKLEAELGINPSDTFATVKARLDALAPLTALAALAPLASPTFTGDPKAPTPSAGDNDTSIATTAFVKAAIDALINGAPGTLDTLKEIADQLAADESAASALTTTVASKAPLASPTFTGDPKAPTPSAGDNDTSIATTAFVQTATGLLVPKTLVDAKGDLLVGTADDTVGRLAVGSDGQVLQADSAQSGGMKWAAPAVAGYPVPMVSGRYGQVMGGTGWTGPSVLVQGEMVGIPFYVTRAVTMTGIGISTWTAGSAGAAIRFGIYDSTDDAPDALLVDFGTLDQTAGARTKTGLSQALKANHLYFLAYAAQGTPSTSPQYLIEQQHRAIATLAAASLGDTSTTSLYAKTGITGAFPSSWGTLANTASLAPKLFLLS